MHWLDLFYFDVYIVTISAPFFVFLCFQSRVWKWDIAVGYHVMHTDLRVSVSPIFLCIRQVSSVSRRLSYGGFVMMVQSDIFVPYTSFMVSCISLVSNVIVSLTHALMAFCWAICIISGSISVPTRSNVFHTYCASFALLCISTLMSISKHGNCS